jgi:hypothetical protein
MVRSVHESQLQHPIYMTQKRFELSGAMPAINEPQSSYFLRDVSPRSTWAINSEAVIPKTG